MYKYYILCDFTLKRFCTCFIEWESNRNHIELILKFSSCRLTHTQCKPRGYCGAENKNQTPLIQLSFAQISATNVSVAEREQFQRICLSPFRCCCLCHFIKPHAQYNLYQPMHGKPGSKVWRFISVAFGKRSNRAEKHIFAQKMRQNSNPFQWSIYLCWNRLLWLKVLPQWKRQQQESNCLW